MVRGVDAETVFAEAIAIPSLSARAAFLDLACRDDSVLRKEVERLILDFFRAGDFLEQPIAQIAAPPFDVPPLERPGTQIGPYTLLEQLGEGGMGVVYVAEQQDPVRRKVALKIIKPGMDTREVVARFAAEQQALALMNHPNIAHVFDAGATAAGRPYFVMELVAGTPVTDFCDRQQLTMRERLDVFVALCHGVQHAHQKGVIHRDLKPSNVLVEMHDDRPVPKIIDFGVAKAVGPQLADETRRTGVSQLVGTPMYMSPEQADQGSAGVDTRSDVYSLGVLLYELLTGHTPFARDSLRIDAADELRRIIREVDPPRPSARVSTLAAADLSTVSERRQVQPGHFPQQLRGDLDWIVMKALDKDPDRRYQSSNALAEDIQRYLHDEPVLAGPPSPAYRLRKFVRRNRHALLTASAATLVLLLGAGTIGGSVGYLMRDRALRFSETARAVEDALAEADAWQQQGKWSTALGAAQRAQAVAASQGGSGALRARVQQRIKDLTMVLRVEEVRLEASAVRGARFDWGLGDRLYTQAFRDYGIDIDVLSPKDAAQRMPGGAVRGALAAALDDWARMRRATPGKDPRDWKRVLAAAQATDPDPWRNQLREAWLNNAKQTAHGLLESAPHESFSPSQVILAAWLLDEEHYIGLLRDAQFRHPADFWLNEELATRLTRTPSGDRQEALGFARAALAVRPDSPGALLTLANAHLDLERYDDAVAVLKRAIHIQSDHVSAYNNLGIALGKMGDVKGFREAYRTAIRIDPTYAPVHYNLGSDLIRIGALDEAESALREAIRLNPLFVEAHCNLGAVLAKQGDLDGAEAAHRMAVRINPLHAQARSGLGAFLCDSRQDYDGAIAAFRRAIELGLTDGRAHYNLGNALREKGEFEEAITAYRQAIVLDPRDGDYHGNLGEALRRAGHRVEAIAELQVAIQLKPDSPAPHIALGTALCDNGDTDGAIAQYQEAIRLQPNNFVPHINLCIVQMEKESWDEAIAAAREAIRCKPDLPEAHCNLGHSLRHKGQLLEALEALQHGHELGIKNPQWRYPSAQWVRECQELLNAPESEEAWPGLTTAGVEPAPESSDKEEESVRN